LLIGKVIHYWDFFHAFSILDRTRIEHCFGILKSRFSILYSGCRLDLKNVPKAIMSCAILHNIAIEHNVPLPEGIIAPDDPSIDDESIAPEANQNNVSERQARLAGVRRRNEIANTRFG
jgi:hypothetical protein